MLLTRDAFMKALVTPDPDVRLWAVWGRNAEDAQALVEAAARGLGGDIEDLRAADVEDAPGRLLDAAASLPMFGGRPLIRVLGADNRLAAAAEALLEARAAGNPVLVLAGDLRKDGALPALVTRHRLARGVIAYGLEPGQVKAAVAAAARAAGLRLDGEGAARLWAAAQGSLGVLAREAEKIALYLGATPAAPVRVEPDVLDRLLPGDETEDFGRLVMAVLTGDVAALDRELRAEPSPIPLFRGLMPRLLQLGELADVVATGRSPAEAVAGARPPVFWKDRDLMTRALGAWPPERVRAAMALLLEAERAIKTAGSAGDRLGRHAILSAALPPRRRGALGRAPLNS